MTSGSSRRATVRSFWVVPSAAARRIGRAYFAVQAVAGAAWWVAVFTLPVVREATLGGIDPVLMEILDIPLFVVGSALAAAGLRWAAGITAVWTLVVTLGLAVYATITAAAGWGALVMSAAGVGSAASWLLIAHGRIPAELLLSGPLGFSAARSASPRAQVARTLGQMMGFWICFLVVLPGAIALLEARWGVGLGVDLRLPWIGGAVLLGASALGLWSACSMAFHGDGTPLPAATANRLVISGPYRWVRNPMAVAGITQAVGVGMILGSWHVVAFALI